MTNYQQTWGRMLRTRGGLAKPTIQGKWMDRLAARAAEEAENGDDTGQQEQEVGTEETGSGVLGLGGSDQSGEAGDVQEAAPTEAHGDARPQVGQEVAEAQSGTQVDQESDKAARRVQGKGKARGHVSKRVRPKGDAQRKPRVRKDKAPGKSSEDPGQASTPSA